MHLSADESFSSTLFEVIERANGVRTFHVHHKVYLYFSSRSHYKDTRKRSFSKSRGPTEWGNQDLTSQWFDAGTFLFAQGGSLSLDCQQQFLSKWFPWIYITNYSGLFFFGVCRPTAMGLWPFCSSPEPNKWNEKWNDMKALVWCGIHWTNYPKPTT